MSDSPQLKHWRGDFGDAYTDRNAITETVLADRERAWARILGTMATPPKRILEVGANAGLNLRAIARVSDAELTALEPNDSARARLIADGVVLEERALGGYAGNIAEPDGYFDLVFTCGVMIHIPESELAPACREIYRVTRGHIACLEYFSPTPETIPYRGHDQLLFKRDFGGFWLDLFPDLSLVDYGFFWKRVSGLDDLTWWLFKKS